MENRRWNLIERHCHKTLEPFTVRCRDIQVDFSQLTNGLSAGVWRLKLTTPTMSVSFLPTRGMGIESIQFDDWRLGWKSPVSGPVNPQWVPVSEPSGLGWLDGFDELLVRCGLTSNGAPQFDQQGKLELPLHGRIANLPTAQLSVQESSYGLEIISEVDECRFHFEKWRLTTTCLIQSDSNRVVFHEEISNLAGVRNDCQILYHFNLGLPLLQPGGRIHVPLSDLVPRNSYSAESIKEWNEIQMPSAGSAEQVFFGKPLGTQDGRCLAVLTNASESNAAGIEFNVQQLPCFSIWKNFVDPRDGYVVGLEPATNFPNPKRFERQQGRTVGLNPDEAFGIDWAIEIANDSRSTQGLIDRVKAIQSTNVCHLEPKPHPDWCDN